MKKITMQWLKRFLVSAVLVVGTSGILGVFTLIGFCVSNVFTLAIHGHYSQEGYGTFFLIGVLCCCLAFAIVYTIQAVIMILDDMIDEFIHGKH